MLEVYWKAAFTLYDGWFKGPKCPFEIKLKKQKEIVSCLKFAITVMPDITSLYILLSLSHFCSTLPLSLKDDAPQPRSSCTPGTKVSLWSMLSQADVFSFMPNDADICLWCWLMFNDAYWCWLMLNYVYWCWCWFVLIACIHFALCAKLSINWKIVYHYLCILCKIIHWW